MPDIMKKLLLCCILLAAVPPLLAQIPRNATGHYEYSQVITTDSTTVAVLQQRAEKFFSRPMLAHWDSTYSIQYNGASARAADGYIEINLTKGLWGDRAKVGLQYAIIPSGNGYQYSIGRLVVRGKEGKEFPLEEKPAELKHKHYDQLVNRTHRYLQRVIGYMKREMSGVL